MKGTVIRLLMVLGWTAALPLVGFAVLAIMTFWPLFGVLLGPTLLLFIYSGGGIPALLTAAAFEFGFRHLEAAHSLMATVTLGAAVSVLWIAFYTFWESGRTLVGADYLTFAVAMAGAASAALMPLTRFAKDRRRWG